MQKLLTRSIALEGYCKNHWKIIGSRKLLKSDWCDIKLLGGAVRYLQAPGVVPRQFFLGGPLARELSIFADESGDRGGSSKYYLLTLVFHDQSKSILNAVGVYENSLREG